MNDSPPIESPCTKVCTLDASGRLCLGCFRNIDEIIEWTLMPDNERANVVAELPKRRRDYEVRIGGSAWATLQCVRCGASFRCGAEDPDHPCWCAFQPPIAPSEELKGCLCPACLAAAATT